MRLTSTHNALVLWQLLHRHVPQHRQRPVAVTQHRVSNNLVRPIVLLYQAWARRIAGKDWAHSSV